MRIYKPGIICMCFILLTSASNVFGAATNVASAEIMVNNYVTAIAHISINGNTANVSGKITGVLGKTTKTSIHLYLQQYKNGSWVNIDDWTSSGNTASRSISKTRIVTKGYKYRAKAVCSAYAGNDKEIVTKYSSALNY